MKLKELEWFLQSLDDFESPKIHLEQYSTRPHIAAHLLHAIDTRFDDIRDKLVADLGCGAGILTTGAAVLGAGCVVGFDLDEQALTICRGNLEDNDVENYELVAQNVVEMLKEGSDDDENSDDDSDDNDGDDDVDNVDDENVAVGIENDHESRTSVKRPFHRWSKMFDTVIMNPPFGTKRNAGMDMTFLQTGIALASSAVYSLHKTSTRDHVIRKCKEWKCEVQIVAELRYDLPQTYNFHKKKSVDIQVDFVRVVPPES